MEVALGDRLHQVQAGHIQAKPELAGGDRLVRPTEKGLRELDAERAERGRDQQPAREVGDPRQERRRCPARGIVSTAIVTSVPLADQLCPQNGAARVLREMPFDHRFDSAPVSYSGSRS
jgi:hypothetical protein